MNRLLYWLFLSISVFGFLGCSAHDRELVLNEAPPEVERTNQKRNTLSYVLEDALGRPATYQATHNKSEGPWTLLCGIPLEIDESPFNYENSKLSENYLKGLGDNSFCSLIKRDGPQSEVVEFDIGSNDMPAIEWLEIHEIPAEILDD